jgi:saccharopine dehydrogenase-like NADP-dependent oxidoreductase
MDLKRIAVIGGAGDMARVAEEKLLSICEGCRLVIADIDLDKAREAAERLDTTRAEAARVDIYDPEGLREAIRGSDLVLNCTGPYYRTGRPVLEACIDEKVDYIDLGDDDESATALLELEGEAREAEVTALICCGIAPGMVNVMARAFALEMDEVTNIDLAWVTGSTPPKEGKKKGGAAVIEHMVHCCMGQCATVRDGKRVMIPSFRRGHVLDFPQPLGSYQVFELGHAETATMPRFFPKVRNVRTMGALNPPYLNGVFRGIARQVDKGAMDMKEAVGILMALDAGEEVKGIKPYLAVLGGVISQLFRREMSLADFRVFLREVAGKPSGESLGGLLVAVEGLKEGKKVRMQASESERQGGPEGGMDMDEATGTPLAVFASMLLDGLIEDKGVLAPEGCIDPEEFLLRLERAMPGYGEAMQLEETEV